MTIVEFLSAITAILGYTVLMAGDEAKEKEQQKRRQVLLFAFSRYIFSMTHRVGKSTTRSDYDPVVTLCIQTVDMTHCTIEHELIVNMILDPLALNV